MNYDKIIWVEKSEGLHVNQLKKYKVSKIWVCGKCSISVQAEKHSRYLIFIAYNTQS